MCLIFKVGSCHQLSVLIVIHWSTEAKMGILAYLISSSVQGKLGIISVSELICSNAHQRRLAALCQGRSSRGRMELETRSNNWVLIQ